MQKIKHNAHLVIIIAILFVSGLSFSSFFRAQGNLLATPVSADEDEEDDDEEDQDEDEDKDEDEDDDIDDDKNEDEDDEDEQKTTRTKTSTQIRYEGDDDENDDENEAEDDSDDEDENEDSEDKTKDIQELKKDMQKVGIKIGVLASNGISVNAFSNNLSEVSILVSQAESLLSSNYNEAKNLLKNAERKLERLEKLVKMTFKDDDEDDDNNEESAEDATEDVGELKIDIAKMESRLNQASSRGINISAYSAAMSEVKVMFSQAEDKLSMGNYIEAKAIVKLADKKLDRIDDLFEDDDEEEDDDDIAKEYKNEVAMFVKNLKAISEMENSIGEQVSVVAQAQNASLTKIENSINEVNSRGSFTRFFIGPKYGSINEIQSAISENQNRIKVLTELSNQITEPAVKQVLQEQIKTLTQQNVNLKNFVTENESGISMFGWLAKLLA